LLPSDLEIERAKAGRKSNPAAIQLMINPFAKAAKGKKGKKAKKK